MTSHVYEFSRRDLIRFLVWPLVPVALFAGTMHLGSWLNWLPSPRPIVDTDRTILFHQAVAARSQHEANLLLIGDSSCLMNVSAPQLEQRLGGSHRVRNLGTLSYLDLSAYASLLQRYISANPGRLRHVVLLMHPEALRRVAPTEFHVEALDHFYAGTDYCDPSVARLFCWLGGNIFQGRILTRAVPLPLSGSFGKRYGFNRDLWRYLSEHNGSAVDPGVFDPKSAGGNAEYRLGRQLENASKTFKGVLPPEVKLLIGITPAPESFLPPNYPTTFKQMLEGWSKWLEADAVLDELPPSFPDKDFAGTAHLNDNGRIAYTDHLARTLNTKLQR